MTVIINMQKEKLKSEQERLLLQYEEIAQRLNDDRTKNGYISAGDVEMLRIKFGELYKVSQDIKRVNKEIGVTDAEPTAFDQKVTEALRSAYGF
ncbi:MAG: hypothetical protein K6A23_16360 [Butyrivibrio sp.]|nr:hypothetical protein [Butyrivibrio sp.]